MSILEDTRSEAARLFKKCRHALGLTVNGMQDELCVLNRTSILRIESGRIDVQGPTWIAMWFLLDEKLTEEPSNVEISTLMDEVEKFIDKIRAFVQERRDKAYGNREAPEQEAEEE